MQIAEPKLITLRDDNAQSYVSELKKPHLQQSQFNVIILPNNRKDRYSAIKQLLVQDDTAIPSQCILAKSLSKPKILVSVCTKIALQINCKMGGQLWSVKIPMKDTMIVGLDVCHDTINNGKSVVGFCASINSTFTRYTSSVAFQPSRQEHVTGFRALMLGILRKYEDVNGKPPERIIIYRDGVGDGQLGIVVESEIPQVLAAIKEYKEGYTAKLAFIVVKKRIHTKFFADNFNPMPGTVIDSGVTQRNCYDFFLISQYVNQGTVTPTHYHVVSDTSGLRADHIQMLTYKLCHLYYNWPGTIRVPAPCQLAHKIAFIVGQSIHAVPSLRISDTYWYL